jgi:hypothetical protein
MYWRKRFGGASDLWGSAVCQRCNRRINLTRRGQFRKHVASKGVECCGSWEFVDIQKERIAIASRLTQACTRTVGTCPPHTVSPNGEYCIDCGIVLLPPAGKA